jgi:hypothetical protein
LTGLLFRRQRRKSLAIIKPLYLAIVKKSTTYLILSIWALLLTTAVYAQKGSLRKANKAFRNKQYDDAIYLYKEVWLDYDSLSLRTKASVFFRIAECYRMLEDNEIDQPLRYAEEIRWYQKAIKHKYYDSTHAKKYIAAAQKQQADFKDTLPKYYLPYMQSSWMVKTKEDKTKSDSTKLRYANKAFHKGEYIDAIDFYKEAYINLGDWNDNQSKAIKARILFQIAECHRMLKDSKQEVQWYRKAIKANCSDSAAAAKYLDAAQKQLSGNTDINK